MYINHCLFSDMINRYNSLLFSNIDDRIFSMPSTRDIWLKQSEYFLYFMLSSFVLTMFG